MISQDFVAMLRCPESRQTLELASATLVERLNKAIQDGKLRNVGGQTVERRLDGALQRSDGQVAYPIIDDIPILLMDDGIPLEQVA